MPRCFVRDTALKPTVPRLVVARTPVRAPRAWGGIGLVLCGHRSFPPGLPVVRRARTATAQQGGTIWYHVHSTTLGRTPEANASAGLFSHARGDRSFQWTAAPWPARASLQGDCRPADRCTSAGCQKSTASHDVGEVTPRDHRE